MGWSIHQPTGVRFHTPPRCYPGYTLVTTNSGDHATLLDMEGRICHRWQCSEGIVSASLLPNGHLMCLTGVSDLELVKHLGGSSAAVLELDWHGNVVWAYRDQMIHLGAERLPNGNTLVLLWEGIPSELASQVRGGYTADEDPGQMFGDKVIEVTPDGSVTYEWRSWEHLRVEEDVICPLEHRNEWGHGNSLKTTPNGDLLVSFRQTDVIGIVDRATGDFRWKWGPGVISHQHDATYLENGRVLLFDNGTHRRRIAFSRVIEVDPETDEIAWEYQDKPPFAFYSSFLSGAQRLPNGNTLICEGAPGRVLEVTPDKEMVWEYISPFFSFSEIFNGNTNAMFRAHRHGPDHPALRDRDLDPGRHANLNRLYAAA